MDKYKRLDRVSFFSHTFELRGKIGITLNTSASNGNDHVAKYLNKVLSSMGCAVVCDISITSYYPTLLFLGDYSIIGHSASTSAFFRVRTNSVS